MRCRDVCKERADVMRVVFCWIIRRSDWTVCMHDVHRRQLQQHDGTSYCMHSVCCGDCFGRHGRGHVMQFLLCWVLQHEWSERVLLMHSWIVLSCKFNSKQRLPDRILLFHTGTEDGMRDRVFVQHTAQSFSYLVSCRVLLSHHNRNCNSVFHCRHILSVGLCCSTVVRRRILLLDSITGATLLVWIVLSCKFNRRGRLFHRILLPHTGGKDSMPAVFVLSCSQRARSVQCMPSTETVLVCKWRMCIGRDNVPESIDGLLCAVGTVLVQRSVHDIGTVRRPGILSLL